MLKKESKKTAILNVKYKGRYTNFTVIWEIKELELSSFSMNAGFPAAKYNKVILTRVEDDNGFEIPMIALGLDLQDILVCEIHRKQKQFKN